MPRSSIIGSGDNLGSIGEEAADEGQFILSRAAASSAQLSTSQPALGKYSSAIDPDSGYGFNTASGPIPPLSRNLSNLQISPGLQQDDSPSYGITTPSMANNAGIPTGSSNLQQNAQEEDDYSDDDTAATSPKSFRMQEMVNSAGIPIRGSNPQRNEWEKDDYYDDDTVATSVPKPFTYSMPPPASTHPLSTSCKIF
jgi:hypothetical protein